MDLIIPWLTTRTVIYPCHWSCSPAPCFAMLLWSGKRTKVFIRKLPSQSWKRTHLTARTASTTRMTVETMHSDGQLQVASCEPHLALQTHIHSWWIPGTHYRRATSRVCIRTLLGQSKVGSNRRRTQRLPWSSAWKQCTLTMVFLLTLWPPK